MSEPKDLKKIANKIAKCLAMSNSDNPAEAEAGRRQAEAMMKKHGLTTESIAASQVKENYVKTGAHKPPLYVIKLATVVARAFGCQMTSLLNYKTWDKDENHMYFFGFGVKPELATYTFDVLRRHLMRDRKVFQETLYRYKRSNKIHLADLFCAAWVERIRKQVHAFAGTEDENRAIDAYIKQKWGDTVIAETRKYPTIKNQHEIKAVKAGQKAAEDISIHKPVQAAGKSKLLE